MYITWDKKLTWPSTNFRKTEMEGEYKGGRPKTDNGLYIQLSVIGEITASLGIKNIYPNVLEADDVISWLSTKVKPSLIMSVDNDLYQLINNDTSFYHMNKKLVINRGNFESIVDIPLDAFLYYKAILGDNSDNIPGFPGFGKVRSKKLAIELASVGGDITKLNLSPEYIDIYRKNLRLMDLTQGFLIEAAEVGHYETQFENLKSHKADFDRFEEWCTHLDITPICIDIEEWKAIFDLRPAVSDTINVLNMLS